MLSLIVTGEAGSFDVMPITNQITWSGGYLKGARKLSFDLISSPYDSTVQVPDLSPGNAISFFQDDRLLFSGTVISREKATGSSTITVSGYDKGFYLLNNQGVYQFSAKTPQEIVRRVCQDFGIKTGDIAKSDVKITRNFIGIPLYQIIMTAYTFAARQNGKAYQIRFSGDRLCVVPIEENEETLILAGGVNLQSAAASDSIEGTVTQAAIYNSDNQLVRTIKNEELIPLYGVLQQVVRQSDGEDAGAEASKLLEENGLSQTITVENLGNIACITGNTVVVKEPYTGLYGLFWITSDSHVWKDGQYYNKLSLSYQRMMDEKEAGSLPNKTGAATSSKTQSTSDSSGSVSKGLDGWNKYVKEVIS